MPVRNHLYLINIPYTSTLSVMVVMVVLDILIGLQVDDRYEDSLNGISKQ